MKEMVVISGQWFLSETRHGPLVHARLNPGGENSGRLVTLIRRQAQRLARERNLGLIIVDGSPGVGCQVIASLSGVDLALVVAEPTLAGLHDFIRIVELADHFGVPAVLCINRWDWNAEVSEKLEREARRRRVGLVGRLPYSPVFNRAQRRGLSVVEEDGEGVGAELRVVWENLRPLVTDDEFTLEIL